MALSSSGCGDELGAGLCHPSARGQAEPRRAWGQTPAGEQERPGAARRRVPGSEARALSSRLELPTAFWPSLAPRGRSVLDTGTKPACLCVCVTRVNRPKAQAINVQTPVINRSVLSFICPAQHLKTTLKISESHFGEKRFIFSVLSSVKI